MCVASKNELSDVKLLFEKRNDFILKWEDFAKVCASWGSKASAIREIAALLNIHEESILFIDDNIGELISASAELSGLKIIYAENPVISTKVLSSFPGLTRFFRNNEDELRNSDIKANIKRSELKTTMSVGDYIKSIHMCLTLRANERENIARISELANKTNQFIFSYKRYTPSEIESLMADASYMVVSLHLKDDLSDSGLIGACVFKNMANYVLLEELYISCRALGRGVDKIMIYAAIELGLHKLGKDKLKVNFISGERNAPAKAFIENYLAGHLYEPDFIYAEKQDYLTITAEE